MSIPSGMEDRQPKWAAIVIIITIKKWFRKCDSATFHAVQIRNNRDPDRGQPRPRK